MNLNLKCSHTLLTFQKIIIADSAFIKDYMENSPNKWLQIASKRVQRGTLDEIDAAVILIDWKSYVCTLDFHFVSFSNL